MPSSSRYLETEYEDTLQREDYKRQRLNKTIQYKESERSECETCLEEFCGCGVCSFRILRMIRANVNCDSSLITLFLYIIFPAFAIVDFVLGIIAKDFGWYDKCVGELVCDWSASACAIWIALALSAFLVATFAVCSKVFKTFCKCCRGEDTEEHDDANTGTSSQRQSLTQAPVRRESKISILSGGGPQQYYRNGPQWSRMSAPPPGEFYAVNEVGYDSRMSVPPHLEYSRVTVSHPPSFGIPYSSTTRMGGAYHGSNHISRTSLMTNPIMETDHCIPEVTVSPPAPL